MNEILQANGVGYGRKQNVQWRVWLGSAHRQHFSDVRSKAKPTVSIVADVND
jgi:hypothetical protein